MGACTLPKENTSNRLKIDREEVKEITLTCFQGRTVTMDEYSSNQLIKDINAAKPQGIMKAMTKHEIKIILRSGKTHSLRIFDDKFKWESGGDATYNIGDSIHNINEYCNPIN